MKKTWKKWVALGMTFSMMAGIAGCGNSKHAGSENTTEAAKIQRKLRKNRRQLRQSKSQQNR